MYEMRAERDEAVRSVLLWHALLPGGEAVALCGHVLSAETQASPVGDEETPTDRYCTHCMTAVGEAMATERH